MRTAYRTAFAMFGAQEVDDMQAADELWHGYQGSDADLVRGMTLVAAVLRKYLIQHAEQVGCPCGTDEWLADTLLEANLHDEEEET